LKWFFPRSLKAEKGTPFCSGLENNFWWSYYKNNMEKDFEALKIRLRIICDRLDPDEQSYFRPLIENFTGTTSEFQRIMRDLGKFGAKISDGSKFGVYREVQHLFEQPRHKK
jgi:hypothetical protein